LQVGLGDHGKAPMAQGFHRQFDVIDHEGHGWPTVRPNQQRIRLGDIHLGLQQSGTNFQQSVRTRRQFHTDQIRLNKGQARSFQDFPALFGMAQKKTHKGTLRRVNDRQCHDPHSAPFKPADHLQELSYPVF
jgi:hypothetical protein